MIGSFYYSPHHRPADVVIEMMWQDGLRGGIVSAPDWVLHDLEGQGLSLRPADEFMRLPFALSYGVLVATSAHAQLTLTGDRDVWMREWGSLVERPLLSATVVPLRGRFESH